MKSAFISLFVLFSSTHVFASVSLTDTFERPQIKTLTLTGGANSLTEKLFNQLSAVREESDSAMGGRVSLNRAGLALNCEKHMQNNKLVEYMCNIEINEDGSVQSPLSHE